MSKKHRHNTSHIKIEQKNEKEPDEYIEFDIIAILKRYWPLLLILVFSIYGFYLRSYHMDYPVIGYHNWKEVRYLTPARHFAEDGFFKHGFFIPEGDFISLKDNPSGAHGDYFPFSSIFAAIGMMIFGEHLWAARLPGAIISTLAIIITYFLVKELFSRIDIALIASFLMAINPLSIFYSHNVDQMPDGFLFMLLGLLFYFVWINKYKNHNLVLSALFIILSIIGKYEYGIILLPMLIVFPFERLRNIKKDYKAYIFCAMIGILGLVWHYYSTEYILEQLGTQGGKMDYATINPMPALNAEFWNTMKDYAADNFTLLGVVFAFFGLIFSIIFFKKKSLSTKFMLAYFVGAVTYFLMIPNNLKGHNYHQFPLLALVVILIAYFMLIISVNLSNIIMSFFEKKNELFSLSFKTITVVALILLLYNPSVIPFFSKFNSRGGTMPYGGIKESANRMFDTQFFGLDVAGEYIKEHKNENDWIMHSQHQAFGILWHADTKSPKGIYRDVDSIKYAEEALNASWLFVYQWDFGIFNEEIWQYYAQNYKLRQIGFTQQGNNQPNLLYMLFQRDPDNETFDVNKLGDYLANKPVYKKEYELTSGKVEMNYINA
ncbi:MAG: glycosyltransferase family 39 protein [archaeon]